MMEARVYYSAPWWYGEVKIGKGWRCVIAPCFTKAGAVMSLKAWLRKHKVYKVTV